VKVPPVSIAIRKAGEGRGMDQERLGYHLTNLVVVLYSRSILLTNLFQLKAHTN
jgi:hypothetical protein